MKAINAIFETDEFNRLRKIKGEEKSWRQFIIELGEMYKQNEKKKKEVKK